MRAVAGAHHTDPAEPWDSKERAFKGDCQAHAEHARPRGQGGRVEVRDHGYGVGDIARQDIDTMTDFFFEIIFTDA